MSEQWRPVAGFPGYEVSDQGRVKSYKRTTPHILAPSVNPQRGYVVMHMAGTMVLLHKIVTRAFYGPRPEGLVVRHLNGDKSDNTIENLRYGTVKENAADSIRLGEHFFASQTHCKRGHEFTVESESSPGRRVCKTCKIEGARRRNGHKARVLLPDSVIADVVRRFHDGEPVKSLAAECGVTTQAVRNWVAGRTRAGRAA